MRILRALARVLGWLLTPFVAWAASFLGSWLGARIAGEGMAPRTRLILLIGLGAVFAIGATIAWLRLLRKSPELQEALAVAPDGTPIAAMKDEEEGM